MVNPVLELHQRNKVGQRREIRNSCKFRKKPSSPEEMSIYTDKNLLLPILNLRGNHPTACSGKPNPFRIVHVHVRVLNFMNSTYGNVGNVGIVGIIRYCKVL